MEIAAEVVPPSGEFEGEIAEIAGIEGEIAAPLPLLRTAWLRGELPREPDSLGPQAEHLHVEGRSYLLDAPTELRQWERGEKRYSLRSLVFALQHVHLP